MAALWAAQIHSWHGAWNLNKFSIFRRLYYDHDIILDGNKMDNPEGCWAIPSRSWHTSSIQYDLQLKSKFQYLCITTSFTIYIVTWDSKPLLVDQGLVQDLQKSNMLVEGFASVLILPSFTRSRVQPAPHWWSCQPTGLGWFFWTWGARLAILDLDRVLLISYDVMILNQINCICIHITDVFAWLV